MRTATSPTAEPFSFTGACAKNMTYGVTVNFAGVVFRMTCVKAEAILTVQTICLEKKKKKFSDLLVVIVATREIHIRV
jgi:hypothetical protein